MKGVRRVFASCVMLAFVFGSSLAVAAPEQLTVKQVLRNTAKAYEKIKTYQDISDLQVNADLAAMGLPKEQVALMEKMKDMTKFRVEFALSKPKHLNMKLQNPAMSTEAICDASRVSILLRVGDTLNQYIEKPAEGTDLNKILLSASAGAKNQNQMSDFAYTMLCSENPLGAFSELVDSATLEGQRKQQVKLTRDRSEMRDVYVVSGKLAKARFGEKGITGTAKIFIDASSYCILQAETAASLDMGALREQLPPEMAQGMPTTNMVMKYKQTEEHFEIKIDEDIPPDRFVFKPPQGSTLVDKFDYQSMMKQGSAPGGKPGPKAAAANGTGGSIELGSKAPEFSLKDLSDQTVSLADLKGKTVVLSFWATWSGSCKRQGPVAERIYQKFKDKDVTFIGVYGERAKKKIEEFATSNGLTFQMVTDPDKLAFKPYNVTTMPRFVVINANGEIAKDLEGMQSESTLSDAVAAVAGK